MAQLYNIRTGLAIVNADDLDSSAAADQLAVCNFTAGLSNYTYYYADDGPAVSSAFDWGSAAAEYAASFEDDGSGSTTWWDADNCERVLVFEHNACVEFVHGFLSPIVVLLTLVNNSLTCAVLLQRNMRTPTNVLLVALAVSDALTGVVPVPAFVRFYATGRYRS